MNPPLDIAGAVRSALRGNVADLDGAQVGNVLGQIKAARGVLDSFEAKVTAHAKRLHESGQSAPAADLHTRNGGVSAHEARAKERRAETLEHAPALAEKLEEGAITAGHADALANATTRIDDDTRRELFDRQDDLAADAARMTPEEFAKNCRDLIALIERDQGVEREQQQRRNTRLTKKVDRDGMYLLNARMHPELGNIVFNAIDAETASLVKAGGDRTVDRASVAADALGNLVTSGHQSTRPAEAEIRVHIDASTLVDGPHDDTVCEYVDGTPLPPTTVRRMVCNGRTVPIVIDINGVVLNAGQDQRLANRHQRRALRAMYRTCAFHGCDVLFDRCEIHHILPWEHGGRTDLDDLLPLCSRHHHVVHDLGLYLDLDDDRTLTITQADGEVFAVIPLRKTRSASWVERSADGGGDGTKPPSVRHDNGPPDPSRTPGQLEFIA